MNWSWPTIKKIKEERAKDTVIHIVFKSTGQIRTINNESPYMVAVDVEGNIIIKPRREISNGGDVDHVS